MREWVNGWKDEDQMCFDAIWAKCEGDGLARLRAFDLPMRFSAVFQLFVSDVSVSGYLVFV